ncbi:magnesium and cobalt transport protein CorA [Parafrankia colletiae]|uniref:Magnesium transport protein CorA n=1 Tax=Parafrankia colletiae TaxID=573497 RepID=A0A1S1QJQ2_9ACTN|nr:magnesium/cobalt transporter CorA [Parafrankia colletiae]MCK9901475.1 magnesium/cobalt transporter CorA [Frankia sp. Cpl3]OHV33485.1 magnesium and cobalt transport protein CorA [Parafrankia colletiae]
MHRAEADVVTGIAGGGSGGGRPGREPDHGHGHGEDHDGGSLRDLLAGALARPVSLVRTRPKRPPRLTEEQLHSGRVVACHVYAEGRRVPDGSNLLTAANIARRQHGAFAWLGLFEPSDTELASIAEIYGLPPLAVEDAVVAHQRPKIELYGSTLFMVLKTACYVEHDELTADTEVVVTGEVMVFIGNDFVVTVRHGNHGALEKLRADLEGRPEMLQHGPSAVLHAVCDGIVDNYLDLVERLDADVDAAEASVFERSARPSVEKLYQLKREVLEFKHAVAPLNNPLRMLSDTALPMIDPHVRDHFRDVFDHLVQVTQRIAHLDELLSSILQATLTQVTISQNEDMRKISAWVAIGAVPTALAGIYGMNFDHMPELRQVWGYPAVLLLMATICLSLHRAFRRNGWL